MNRLGNRDDVAVDEPPQHDLGYRLAMHLTDLREDRVGEQVVLFLGEAAPRFDLDAVRPHQILSGVPLEERVDLDLVDRRCDVVVVDQIHEAIRTEIRHPDGSGEPISVDLLHSPARSCSSPRGADG